MKIFEALLKKTSSFIFKKFELAILISVAFAALVAFVNFYYGGGIESIGIYTLLALAAFVCAGVCIFRTVTFKFGHISIFTRDRLWNRLKRKGETKKYYEICLDTASAALLLELPLGILSIILKLIFG